MNRTTHIPGAAAKPRTLYLAAAALAAALTGCGGGSDAVNPDDLPGSLTITGTAATVVAGSTSNAIAGAAVYVTCKRGDASGMTSADGTFSVTVAKPGVAPCVLQLFRTDNSSLRSVATGSGNFNITPMTELLVQYVSAQITSTALPVSSATTNNPTLLTTNPAFEKLMGSPALLNNSLARTGAIAKAFPAPASPGLAVPADYLTGQLVARSPATAGNAQNAFLEELRARNTISAAGVLSTVTAAEAVKDASLPANKVVAP